MQRVFNAEIDGKEENYKNILTHNTFFKDNLPPEHRLKLQDIITIDK